MICVSSEYKQFFILHLQNGHHWKMVYHKWLNVGWWSNAKIFSTILSQNREKFVFFGCKCLWKLWRMKWMAHMHLPLEIWKLFIFFCVAFRLFCHPIGCVIHWCVWYFNLALIGVQAQAYDMPTMEWTLDTGQATERNAIPPCNFMSVLHFVMLVSLVFVAVARTKHSVWPFLYAFDGNMFGLSHWPNSNSINPETSHSVLFVFCLTLLLLSELHE